MKDLISVVVPIYNVEKYIEKCIISILKQNYSNLEILLVIDGSKDKSKEICYFYQKRDSRIKVLEKENGGLSDARNYGLKNAKGKYIVFIDGDDFINENMINTLYHNIIKENADISVCGFSYYYEDGRYIEYQKQPEPNYIIFNSEEALKCMMDKSISFRQCAWNKLYKTILFSNIEYPFGKLYEDMGTTYKLLDKANKIVYFKESLYYYVQRNNSITKTFTFNERELNRIEMVDNLFEFIMKNYPSIKKEATIFRIEEYLAVINVMIKCRKYDKKLINKTKEMIKENKKIVKECKNKKKKFQIIVFEKNFEIYKIIFKLFSK